MGVLSSAGWSMNESSFFHTHSYNSNFCDLIPSNNGAAYMCVYAATMYAFNVKPYESPYAHV